MCIGVKISWYNNIFVTMETVIDLRIQTIELVIET